MASPRENPQSHQGGIVSQGSWMSQQSWVAPEVVPDARPFLPKAAFFMGDLRDGLPMVSFDAFSILVVLGIRLLVDNYVSTRSTAGGKSRNKK
jgi:hypothetical protein